MAAAHGVGARQVGWAGGLGWGLGRCCPNPMSCYLSPWLVSQQGPCSALWGPLHVKLRVPILSHSPAPGQPAHLEAWREAGPSPLDRCTETLSQPLYPGHQDIVIGSLGDPPWILWQGFPAEPVSPGGLSALDRSGFCRAAAVGLMATACVNLPRQRRPGPARVAPPGPECEAGLACSTSPALVSCWSSQVLWPNPGSVGGDTLASLQEGSAVHLQGCGCGFLYWGTGWRARIPGLPLAAWPRLSTWGPSTQAHCH